MKKKFINLAYLFLASMMLVGCDSCDYPVISSKHAGNFMAINMATNDTLTVIGGAIVISIGETEHEKLSAKNGNIIKLVFEPAEVYSKYRFSTEFVTHDGAKIKDVYTYEYAIKDTEPGQYAINMSATYRDNDGNDIDIHSSETVYLEVKE